MSRNRRPSASDRGPRVGATTPPQPLRVDAVDALRGLALCLMIGYHFCFDLRHFGWLAADFEHDLFWLGLRALILSTFMALVGVSLVLADRAGQEPAHFRRRLGAVAACAALVSAASYVVFPQSFIYFGVLHCIVVATLIARPLVRRPWPALALGAAMVAAGNFVAAPLFDAPVLSFIGLRTVKPLTEDYVPLLPWAGVTLLGVALATRSLTPRNAAALARLRPPRLLGWMGRHSLAIYMAHQPLLLGALWLVNRTIGTR